MINFNVDSFQSNCLRSFTLKKKRKKKQESFSTEDKLQTPLTVDCFGILIHLQSETDEFEESLHGLGQDGG